MAFKIEANRGITRNINPIVDRKFMGICTRPYEGHKKGCPNFKKRWSCPGYAPFLFDLLKPPFHVVWNRFHLGAHVERMREKHPNWSYRQLSCCLYWQNTARRQLRALVSVVKYDSLVLYVPEACGVNVTATMAPQGVELEWPPRKYTYQVALLGDPVDGWETCCKSEFVKGLLHDQ